MKKIGYSFIIILTLILVSCSKSPQPIEFGLDNCKHCMMKISDERYGAELITQKGKIFKFDDMYCMKAFVEEQAYKSEDIHSLWLVDFEKKKELLSAEKSFLLENQELKSPMGSNTAAFASEEERQIQFNQHSGTLLLWKDYFKLN